MPDLDGLEATRRLRQDPHTAHIPVIAVTASAFGDTRQAARDAGCTDYLPKPVRAEVLYAMLHDRLGLRFVSEDEAPAMTAGAARRSTRREAIASRMKRRARDRRRDRHRGPGAGSGLQEIRASRRSASNWRAWPARFDFDGLNRLARRCRRQLMKPVAASVFGSRAEAAPVDDPGRGRQPGQPPGAGPNAARDRPPHPGRARRAPARWRSSGAPRPDLVLLDVMMPGQDGFELCRTIQGSEAADTMVIFLSALGETSDKVLGLTLGAVDYITKPIQTEEVLARVSNHLARQHLEREVRRHPRSPEQGTGQRRAACSACCCPRPCPTGRGAARGALQDQPPRRRGLLRRARPRRQRPGNLRRRCVGSRRSRCDRDGHAARGAALAGRAGGSRRRCCDI